MGDAPIHTPLVGHALAETSTKRGVWVGDGGAGTIYATSSVAAEIVAASDTTPILEDGQIVISTDYLSYAATAVTNPVACQANGDVVTCWDTVTAHGLQLSSSQALTW